MRPGAMVCAPMSFVICNCKGEGAGLADRTERNRKCELF